jgi:VWFA-related protein
MEDGSPPPKSAAIERFCGANRIMMEGITNSRGEFILRGSQFETVGNWGSRQFGAFGAMKCYLRAELKGYESSLIDLDDPKLLLSLNLPPIVLHPRGSQPKSVVNPAIGPSVRAPSIATKMWERAGKAMNAGNWPEAERELRMAVTVKPEFAPAWGALGLACQNQNKPQEARDAYQKAIAAAPSELGFDVLLLQLESSAKNWPNVTKISTSLIAKDTNHTHLEAYVHRALAQLHLHDLDNAAKSAAEAIELDKNHRVPTAEYLYGLILESRKEYPAAEQHYRKYLEIDPKADNVKAVRQRLAALGKGIPPGGAGNPIDDMAELSDVILNVRAVSSVPVPGGIKALSSIAHLDAGATSATFFADYCRAIVRATDYHDTATVPAFQSTLRAYFSTLPELTALGVQSDRGSTVTISLRDDKAHAAKVLQLLGWRLDAKSSTVHLEMADSLSDGPRHPVAEALGIDEIDLLEHLQSGRPYTFEVPSEEAPLMGGDSWLLLVNERQMLPGGLAEVFVRDLRLARAYVGLSAAGAEASEAMVTGLSLRTLVQQHAESLYLNGAALRMKGGAVQAPGGAAAEIAWSRLVGASLQEPAAFFRALLEKDQGRLAAFYSSLAGTEESRLRYFTASPARLQSYYAVYGGPRERTARPLAAWHDGEFSRLPLSPDGQVRWPGGLAAWADSADAAEKLLHQPESVAQLLALAKFEADRNTPLNAESVSLWRRHFSDWSPLLPQLVALPSLGPAELQSLERFTTFARAQAISGNNSLLGQWYSLVQLVTLSARAGALDQPAAAALFQRICDGLATPGHSAKAIEIVRSMVGAADLDEGIPANLLRLRGAHRAAFDRVMTLQAVPSLQAAAQTKSDKTTMHALAGIIYAALLSPDGLLVSEDTQLLAKHHFASSPKGPLFAPATLDKSNKHPGSRFAGGFTGFGELARHLPSARTAVAPPAIDAAAQTVVAATAPEASEAPIEGQVFRADARLVEVYATVTDSHGRYADELPASEFTVLEEGRQRGVVAFESRLAGVTCALLLDNTLSMQSALPSLKNAALELIGQLRDADSLMVYTFSDSVIAYDAPSRDKTAGRRAVIRTRAKGDTALYDALIRVIRDMSALQGKKAIAVFTDGDDNTSSLGAENVIRRAKAAGIPIYTIAQGTALANPALPRLLSEISKGTGGLPFSIREPKEIQEVFDAVAKDLTHGYLLTVAPASEGKSSWRSLGVKLPNKPGYKVRSREGYYPE